MRDLPEPTEVEKFPDDPDEVFSFIRNSLIKVEIEH